MQAAGPTIGILFIAHWAIIVVLSVRVILRRRPVGASLAWLIVLLLVPFVGAAFYLLIGENRLGQRRARRMSAVVQRVENRIRSLGEARGIDWSQHHAVCGALHHHAASVIGFPALPDNQLELIDDADAALRAIIADIDRARRTCHLVFYIWSAGGVADEVADALLRAAARGVACRVLLDAVGSFRFLESRQAARLRAGGVRVVAALPVGLIRMLFVRLDLRNHRKIVVIDGEVGYTGSMNLADPRQFKRSLGVGMWIDAMVRVRGPAVEALNLTFLIDWEVETGETIEKLPDEGDLRRPPAEGASTVQVVPSGPGEAPRVIHEMLISTVYAARRELIMTTPYFVPDDSMLAALKTAARRGVDVIVVIPAKTDAPLVKYAGASYFDELLEAGVRITRYRRGLLHAKTITVDAHFGLIGSVNIDMRSFWLDFEVTLFVYDPAFTEELRAVQFGYIAEADELELATWQQRPVLRRFLENSAQLLGPLL